MPDIRSLHNINNEFGDVLCMIANPLHRFSDKQIIEPGRNRVRIDDLAVIGLADCLTASGSRLRFAGGEDPFEAGPVRCVVHIDQRVPG